MGFISSTKIYTHTGEPCILNGYANNFTNNLNEFRQSTTSTRYYTAFAPPVKHTGKKNPGQKEVSWPGLF